MKKFIPWLVVILATFLIACNLIGSLTEIAMTPTPLQFPATEITPATPTQLPATATPTVHPPVPIVYYYFVAVEGKTFPAGSVVILPDILILGPTLSNIARSPDTVTNISSALQAMINDPRSAWTSDDLGISSITFSEGKAGVVLQGKIFGAGDVVLIAARMQILMTVFTEAAVQSAAITLNGENIANLGISHPSEAQPADYTYTRADIEAFMAEHAYGKP